MIDDPAELKKLLDLAGKRTPFRVLFKPQEGAILDHWRRVGVTCYSTGNMLLCIDEIGMICEYGQFMQDTPQKNVDPILKSIVHYGRHRKIDVICTAQRPTDVARRYTALCTEMRIFQTSENSDLTYLAKRVGELPVSKLPGLPKFVFLRWTDNEVGIYKASLSKESTKCPKNLSSESSLH